MYFLLKQCIVVSRGVEARGPCPWAPAEFFAGRGGQAQKKVPHLGKVKKIYRKSFNHYFFLQNNGNFLRQKSDQNIHENARNCTIFSMFFGGEHVPEPRSMCATDIIISI